MLEGRTDTAVRKHPLSQMLVVGVIAVAIGDPGRR